MRRNIKKEVVWIGDKKFTFESFCETMYKAQEREISLPLYIIHNKKELREGWDGFVTALYKKHKAHKSKFTTKVKEKLKKWFS